MDGGEKVETGVRQRSDSDIISNTLLMISCVILVQTTNKSGPAHCFNEHKGVRKVNWGAKKWRK